ncbi:MAG: hypothetical protein U0984_02205 [Prosthecobacter sp.]|nr:hypothetical protein [Prosthecobacter sp.]
MPALWSPQKGKDEFIPLTDPIPPGYCDFRELATAFMARDSARVSQILDSLTLRDPTADQGFGVKASADHSSPNPANTHPSDQSDSPDPSDPSPVDHVDTPRPRRCHTRKSPSAFPVPAASP